LLLKRRKLTQARALERRIVIVIDVVRAKYAHAVSQQSQAQVVADESGGTRHQNDFLVALRHV
jgi:hypothetical protein